MGRVYGCQLVVLHSPYLSICLWVMYRGLAPSVRRSTVRLSHSPSLSHQPPYHRRLNHRSPLMRKPETLVCRFPRALRTVFAPAGVGQTTGRGLTSTLHGTPLSWQLPPGKGLSRRRQDYRRQNEAGVRAEPPYNCTGVGTWRDCQIAAKSCQSRSISKWREERLGVVCSLTLPGYWGTL